MSNGEKGTVRSPQEYVNPLLVLSAREYGSISFVELHTRICDALPGAWPTVVTQSFTANGECSCTVRRKIINTTKGPRGNRQSH